MITEIRESAAGVMAFPSKRGSSGVAGDRPSTLARSRPVRSAGAGFPRYEPAQKRDQGAPERPAPNEGNETVGAVQLANQARLVCAVRHLELEAELELCGPSNHARR